MPFSGNTVYELQHSDRINLLATCIFSKPPPCLTRPLHLQECSLPLQLREGQLHLLQQIIAMSSGYLSSLLYAPATTQGKIHYCNAVSSHPLPAADTGPGLGSVQRKCAEQSIFLHPLPTVVLCLHFRSPCHLNISILGRQGKAPHPWW
ncbi:hypothetical protein llap_11477 [Limosa lapponica baueri]|uniref:Uncharacterized protein n=1 Tax=Limosa lapponica baueri TaxID=1758121 RepID=A0A2I0TWZ2_LIMLA|nr:hypothetical protein llap_11477 [Limosa lapponica baueri]